MSREYKTTAADFRLYVTTCKQCIEKWGIRGWRVSYTHALLSESRAQCATSWYTHVATLTLSTKWDTQPTRETIIYTARHEVLHLILDELDSCAQARYTTNDHRKQALERTVHHFESLVP